MKIKDESVLVVKNLFTGQFWDGTKWIIPKSIDDILNCRSAASNCSQLDLVAHYTNADRQDLAFSRIIVEANLVF